MSDIDIFGDYSSDTSDVFDVPDSNIDESTYFYDDSIFPPMSPGSSPTPRGDILQNIFGSLFSTNTTGYLTPTNLQTGLTNLANTLFPNFFNKNQAPATSATAGNNTVAGVPVKTLLLIGGGVVVLYLLLRK